MWERYTDIKVISATIETGAKLHCAACRSVSPQSVPVLLSARLIDPPQNPNVRKIEEKKFFTLIFFNF
jgi:hypothetical protein